MARVDSEYDARGTNLPKRGDRHGGVSVRTQSPKRSMFVDTNTHRFRNPSQTTNEKTRVEIGARVVDNTSADSCTRQLGRGLPVKDAEWGVPIAGCRLNGRIPTIVLASVG